MLRHLEVYQNISKKNAPCFSYGVDVKSKLLSDDYDSTRTYDGSFQIVRYNYNERYNSVSITLKDQDSNKVITASVPRDCPNQPVNKIIDATINEKTKDFFGLFEENYYSIVSGKVCL